MKPILLILCALSLYAAPCPEAGPALWPYAFPAAITEANCGQIVVLTEDTTAIVLPPQFTAVEFGGNAVLPVQAGTFHVSVYNAGSNAATIGLLGTFGAIWFFPPWGSIRPQGFMLPPYSKVELWPMGFNGWLAILTEI